MQSSHPQLRTFAVFRFTLNESQSTRLTMLVGYALARLNIEREDQCLMWNASSLNGHNQGPHRHLGVADANRRITDLRLV